mmetsp:Transcript_22231/g.57087  ORF Transcript_22231/g.57087 Transcript_22231/m.57087 type:complete len:234 (-) Transcript_22231:1752-2453(-)
MRIRCEVLLKVWPHPSLGFVIMHNTPFSNIQIEGGAPHDGQLLTVINRRARHLLATCPGDDHHVDEAHTVLGTDRLGDGVPGPHRPRCSHPLRLLRLVLGSPIRDVHQKRPLLLRVLPVQSGPQPSHLGLGYHAAPQRHDAEGRLAQGPHHLRAAGFGIDRQGIGLQRDPRVCGDDLRAGRQGRPDALRRSWYGQRLPECTCLPDDRLGQHCNYPARLAKPKFPLPIQHAPPF